MPKHSKIESSYDFTNQDLVKALNETIDVVGLNFGKPNDISKQIVCKYILNVFKQIQLDADNLGYVDFFKKYVNDYKLLSVDDATTSQMKHIINETPINDLDKQIAYKLFVEFKTYDQIAKELDIVEPRTIGNKIEKIRDLVKQTAYKLFIKD